MVIVDIIRLSALPQAKQALQPKAEFTAPVARVMLCVAALALAALAGCAAFGDRAVPAVPASSAVAAPSAPAIVNAILAKRVVLFGEVHDNALMHQKRLKLVEQALARGARPAFAFEQFDREKQSAIDAARTEKSLDADRLIAQGSPGKSSWNWAFYRPLIQLALDNDLPIIAANLSRRDAMKVAQSDFVTSGVFSAAEIKSLRLDQPIPANMMTAQSQAIIDGHCKLLPVNAVPAMANAQLARDAVMAHLLLPFADRGVVLFAGNGHTRADIGVAAWLPRVTQSLSVGMLESSTATTLGLPASTNDARFDVIEYVTAQPREDPCIALKARFTASAAPKN